MFEKLAIFQASASAASYAGKRQSMIAQNVANADTPGYRAQEIARFQDTFNLSADRQQRTTRPGHVSGTGGHPHYARVSYSTSEPAPNGNSVSIEDEMLNSIEASREHNRALTVYRHGMTVIRTVLGR